MEQCMYLMGEQTLFPCGQPAVKQFTIMITIPGKQGFEKLRITNACEKHWEEMDTMYHSSKAVIECERYDI